MTCDNASSEQPALIQPRQYGDAVKADEGLARLAQAQSDEEAMEIEAALLVETDLLLGNAEEPTSQD